MKIRSFLTGLAGLILFSFFSQSILPAQNSVSEECKMLIDQVDVLLGKMQGWDHQSIILYSLTIAIGILGFVIWILQRIKRPWVRGTTSALGLIIVVLTVISTTSFDADYRKVKHNSAQLRAEIADVKNKLKGFDSASAPDKQIYRDTVIALIKKVDGVEEQLLSTQISLAPLSTTYAFSEPRWLSDPFEDRFNDYFQGRGENASLAIAKDLSYDNAIDNAVRQLGSRDARSTVDANDPLRIFFVGSSAVAQSDFSYDASRGVYKYYVLLKISRTLTQPRLIKAVVRS